MDDIVLRNKIRNYKFFVMVGLLVTSTMTHRTPTGTGVAAKLFSKTIKKILLYQWVRILRQRIAIRLESTKPSRQDSTSYYVGVLGFILASPNDIRSR